MSDRTEALKKVWWIERNDVFAIAQKNESTGRYDSITEAGKSIHIHAITGEGSFSRLTGSQAGVISLTESPDIPEEFHHAYANYVIAKGYEKKPETLQQAAYFMNLFEKSIRDAKRQANKGFDGTPYNIQQHDF